MHSTRPTRPTRPKPRARPAAEPRPLGPCLLPVPRWRADIQRDGQLVVETPTGPGRLAPLRRLADPGRRCPEALVDLLERTGMTFATGGILRPSHALARALLDGALRPRLSSADTAAARILLLMPDCPRPWLQLLATQYGHRFPDAFYWHPNGGGAAAWGAWIAAADQHAFTRSESLSQTIPRLAVAGAADPAAHAVPALRRHMETRLLDELRLSAATGAQLRDLVRYAPLEPIASIVAGAPDGSAGVRGFRATVSAVTALPHGHAPLLEALALLDAPRRALVTPALLQPLLKADASEVRFGAVRALAELPVAELRTAASAAFAAARPSRHTAARGAHGIA